MLVVLYVLFEVLGVKNVIAKCLGSTNPVNVVKAAVRSLKDMSSPDMIAQKRGKTVKEIMGYPVSDILDFANKNGASTGYDGDLASEFATKGFALLQEMLAGSITPEKVAEAYEEIALDIRTRK